ncbi:unnamed protein product, partial [Prorocentrum cordatum]
MAAMAGRAAPPAVGRARQEGALPRAPRTFSASLPIRQLRAPGAGAAEGSAGLPARAGAAAGAGALAALVSRTRGRRPRRRPARRPGAALLQGWRSRSAAPACSSGHDLDTLAEWHSATSIRRAWRAERRASILASVRAGWADSVTCAAANKGPRAECMTPTNLTLVGSPPLLWVAFYDTDVEQGIRRAALAKYLFQDVCEQMDSSHMLDGAASCSAPADRGSEGASLETAAHCRATVASPDFPVPDDFSRFDVLVAMSERAREHIVGSDPTGAYAHKVVCITDFVDVCESWPDQADPAGQCRFARARGRGRGRGLGRGRGRGRGRRRRRRRRPSPLYRHLLSR